MSKSIKFTNDVYLDTSSVVYGRQKLNTYLASVIESGKNENGYWTKYSDGTMTCSNSAKQIVNTNKSSGSFQISFAKEFVSAPNIILSNSYFWYSDIIWSTGEITKIGTTVFWNKLSGSVSENQGVTCNYIAIGRWK